MYTRFRNRFLSKTFTAIFLKFISFFSSGTFLYQYLYKINTTVIPQLYRGYYPPPPHLPLNPPLVIAKVVIKSVENEWTMSKYRSSRSEEVFLRKGALKICLKFTREHLYISAVSITLFLKNTSGQLLLRLVIATLQSILWHRDKLGFLSG